MRFRRQPGLPPLVCGLALALIAPAAAHAALEVVGPREVLSRYVHATGDRQVLTVDGRSWDLVLDPRDSSLSTLGDGEFHPMSEDEVRAALTAIDVRLSHLDGKILVLPLPRRDALKSSCEQGTVYLSPGLRPVHAAHVHATVVHEVGHLAQHALVPDGSARWNEYLRMREIDRAPYSDGAIHRDRPHEIFAEDFRFLFGGALANTAGTIENPDLPLPTDVEGLHEWFRLSLGHFHALAGAVHPTGPRSWPNPARGLATLTVRFPGATGPSGAATADVLDVAGRRVRTLAGDPLDGETVGFRWDTRSETGSPVPSGIYFVRWRERPEAGVARVQILH